MGTGRRGGRRSDRRWRGSTLRPHAIDTLSSESTECRDAVRARILRGVSVPATRPPGAARGRRPARPSGDDRELAILATAERLLAERPLAAISVDDLARGAGISRPTFYFYFASKDAVLLTLLDRVVRRGRRGHPPGVRACRRPAPREGWRRAIAAYYETFRAHRALTLAWAEARSTNAEVAGAVGARSSRPGCSAAPTRSRPSATAGAAPAGLPARDLAIALNSMNERVLYATFSGDGPAVAEADVVDVLLEVWLWAIYQRAVPPS